MSVLTFVATFYLPNRNDLPFSPRLWWSPRTRERVPRGRPSLSPPISPCLPYSSACRSPILRLLCIGAERRAFASPLLCYERSIVRRSGAHSPKDYVCHCLYEHPGNQHSIVQAAERVFRLVWGVLARGLQYKGHGAFSVLAVRPRRCARSGRRPPARRRGPYFLVCWRI